MRVLGSGGLAGGISDIAEHGGKSAAPVWREVRGQSDLFHGFFKGDLFDQGGGLVLAEFEQQADQSFDDQCIAVGGEVEAGLVGFCIFCAFEPDG